LYNSILDKLHDRQKTGNCVEADITGRPLALPFDRGELLLPARGTVIPEDMKRLLRDPLQVPCYYLRVESELRITSYISDFQLKASAWTLYSDDQGAWSYNILWFWPSEAWISGSRDGVSRL